VPFVQQRHVVQQLLGLVLTQGNAHLLSAARQLPCVIDHQPQASRDNLPSLSALRFFRWMSDRLLAAGDTPDTPDPRPTVWGRILASFWLMSLDRPLSAA